MNKAAPLSLLLSAMLLLPACGHKPPKSALAARGGPPAAGETELNRAVTLAVRAVEQYERSEPDHALVSLRMAEEVVRAVAKAAGLSPLALLTARLPEHYRKYDLAVLKAELENLVQLGGGVPGVAARGPAAFPTRAPEAPMAAERVGPLIREETLFPGSATVQPASFSGALPSGLRGVDPPRSVQVHAVDQNTFVRNELERLMAEFGETSFDPPESFLADIHRTIGLFQTSKRDFFQNGLDRSVQYAPLIEKVFQKKGVPPDMIYMAFVESGFRPDAVSTSGAVGLWQFMSGTARDYGLNVSSRRDDRRDPIRATVAAREYFLDLLSLFGTRSWLLAMAAYNAGENKIASCLKKIDDPFAQRTFWHINGCLSSETQDYVPRILAAAIIGSDPARFGFIAPRHGPKRPFETVALPGHASVSGLARAAGTSREELLELNPDLDPLQPATPAADASRVYRLNVPAGTGNRIAQQWPELALAGLALKPAAGQAETLAAAPRAGSATRSPKGSGSGGGATRKKNEPSYFVYKVAPGNTMAEIAQAFGVGSYKDIMRWNAMKRTTVLKTQPLKIYRPYRRVLYKVRKGDTLEKIGKKFHVGADKIRFYNGLGRKNLIPGQTLAIYVRSS